MTEQLAARPSYDHLRDQGRRIVERIDALLIRALELETALGEIERQIADALEVPAKVQATRHRLAYELREIDRRLRLCGCDLVMRDEQRRRAADRVSEWARHELEHDHPWRDPDTATRPPVPVPKAA